VGRTGAEGQIKTVWGGFVKNTNGQSRQTRSHAAVNFEGQRKWRWRTFELNKTFDERRNGIIKEIEGERG